MHCFLKVTVCHGRSVFAVCTCHILLVSPPTFTSMFVCLSLSLWVCRFCCIDGTWPWSPPLLVSTHLLMIPHLPLMTSLEPLHKEAVLLPLLDCCMVTAAELVAFMLPLTCEEGIKLFFPVLRFRLEDSLSLRTELSFALK